MDDKQSLSHTKWECKYHLVWIPKYRKKDLYGGLRKYLGSCFKDLASQKESQILEGHLKPDHVHMLISIPPKYSVSQVVGFLKGKSAIQIVRVYLGKRKNFVGQHFWARGYFVSTVGMNEETIRAYIKAQEKEDRRLDQMNLFPE
ncbi:MAG: IS200/IS605 family transposase [Thermodesulfobacteriota bacterium]|nr:IS200/IS605 family transposase [Thermodesulfobacteriota bacterium]